MLNVKNAKQKVKDFVVSHPKSIVMLGGLAAAAIVSDFAHIGTQMAFAPNQQCGHCGPVSHLPSQVPSNIVAIIIKLFTPGG